MVRRHLASSSAVVLIYTPEFQQWPDGVMCLVKERLRAELSDGGIEGPRRGLVPQHLRPEIRQIVSETLPGWGSLSKCPNIFVIEAFRWKSYTPGGVGHCSNSHIARNDVKRLSPHC